MLMLVSVAASGWLLWAGSGGVGGGGGGCGGSHSFTRRAHGESGGWHLHVEWLRSL